MLRIEGENKLTLRLDENSGGTYELSVISETNTGSHIQFSVVSVYSNNIKCEAVGRDKIMVVCDTESVKEKGTIVVENLYGEQCVITVVPHSHLSLDRVYEFRVARYYIEGTSIKFKIISTIDGSPCLWKCTYDGKPIDFEINPHIGSGIVYTTVKINSIIFRPTKSIIEFTQEKSNKKIRVTINIEKGNVLTILCIE